MTSYYEAPPSNLRSLRDRLTQAAKREGIVFGRLQQHVAVLVVTQFMSALTDDQGNPVLLVKAAHPWNYDKASHRRAPPKISTR